MAIINSSLGITANIIVTASSGNLAVSTIHLCNYSSNTQIVNLYAVANGSVAGTNNIIYTNLSITPNNTYIMDAEKFILSVGDAIFANCGNVGTVSATVTTIGV